MAGQRPYLSRRGFLSGSAAGVAGAVLPMGTAVAADRAAAARGNGGSPKSATVIPVAPSDSDDVLRAKAGRVVPTERQLAWQQGGLSAFFHFGVNTFTGREWGTGLEDPDVFSPTQFDPEQWVRVLQGAGFERVILTVKHHDGFVLYPTRYTKHSLESSAWQEGNGDVFGAVAKAARLRGMKVGFYLSPADLHELKAQGGRYGNGSAAAKTPIPTLTDNDDRRHEVNSGDLPTFHYRVDDYNRYFLNQLYELLTQYGPIDEVWLDGANPEPGTGQTYAYQAWYDMIRALRPEAVIAVRGPDARWVGNESGLARTSEWSVIPMRGEPSRRGIDMVAEANDATVSSIELMHQADYLKWYPAEVDVSIRPGWFYHASEDDDVKSRDELLDIYHQSVGRNSVLLLNVPPDRTGQLHDEDVRVLRAFGQARRDIYDRDLARGAEASDDSPGRTRGRFGPHAVVDGDAATYWRPKNNSPTPGQIVLDLGGSRTFNTIELAEAVTVGQRIETFAVDAWVDGWEQVAAATTIGYKRIVSTTREVEARKVRVRILDSRGTPALTTVALYQNPYR